MLALIGLGFGVCAPVIRGPGEPLAFRPWTPRCRLERGLFGVPHPAEGDFVEPDALLAPMLAFDAGGWRLGYGAGFYDRTIADLRSRRPLAAFGLAYAGQEVEAVPRGPEDEPLDAIVTETGLRGFGAAGGTAGPIPSAGRLP